MRIVITGAAGFIGSVLTLRAFEQGDEVIGVDDLSRGLNETLDQGRAHFLKHDCRSGFAEAIPSGVKADWNWFRGKTMIDAVVHLAAGTGSLDRPIEELRGLNVEMTKRVWQDAKDLGAKVFVFPTTSLATKVPDSPYVISKEEAFEWLKTQTDGPRLIPLRFFNVAGSYKGRTEKRKLEVHLIPRLVECYRTGEPLVVNGVDYWGDEGGGDGSPARDFTNVIDVADAILEMIHRADMLGDQFSLQGFTMPDGAMWCGTGHQVTVHQAARIFAQWVGPLDVKAGPRRAFDTGSLICPGRAATSFEGWIARGAAPAWVSIRDEVLELLKTP